MGIIHSQNMSKNNPMSYSQVMLRNDCSLEDAKKYKRTVEDCLRLTYAQVKQRYAEINVELLSTQYDNIRQYLDLKCFICEHKWKSTLMNTDKGRGCPKCGLNKKIVTCRLRYGVDYPSQNHEIALKGALSSNNSYVYFHWKTNKRLVCQGTWEAAVVEHLNKQKINFDWQIQFKMPNGKFYTPDLYLSDQDLWIEIKGAFRTWSPKDDAEQKWNWFHKEHPNSELWDKQKIKMLGLFPRTLEILRERKQQKIQEATPEAC